MANTIILKKSSTASSVPAAGSLQPGELAVNLADKKLYTKTVGGTVILLADGNAAAGSVSSFNTRTGAVTLSSGDVTTALGYTPYNPGANTVLTSANYNTYSPTLTGTGASGTWGISISGSAATLTTARTITIGNTSRSFNGSANVAWTTSDIGAEFQQTLGVPRANLGDPTVREMALFDAEFTNKTELYDITKLWFETSTDNVTWTAFSVTDTQKRAFLTGDSGTNIIIPNGTAYFRVRMRATSYVYLNAFYGYTSTNGHSCTLQMFKKHDSDSAWTQHTNSNVAVSSWPGHFYLPFATIPWNPTATLGTHFHEIYLLITPTWNGAYPANGINLYKGQFWGGYPAGKRNIYSTDELGNVTFPGTLSATTLSGTISSSQVTTALGFTPYNATNPSGYTSNTGTVTSVALSGGTTGLTATGGPITTSGTITLGGTLAASNGGTGLTSPGASGNVLTSNGTSWVSQAPITPTARVSSDATITSPLAWNSDSFDQYVATAQAGALTISADAGTPVDGRKMIFRFKDNGTTRALTWTTGVAKGFRAVGVTLPTSTVASKTVYVGCIYNAADSRWDVVAVAQEA